MGAETVGGYRLRFEHTFALHGGITLRIAHTIASAAKAVSVSPVVIADAVKENKLRARRVDDDKAIILATDLQSWGESLPDFMSTV